MAKRPEPGEQDRRRQARAAQQAAAARAQRRRTITQVAVIGGVAVVVIAIVATAVVLGNRGRTPSATPSGSATVTVAGQQVPLAITDTGVRLGPAGAKTTIDLWVDYSCPHCKEFEAENDQVLGDAVAGGKVAVTYHNIQVHADYGTVAGDAAICVAQHDPAAWPAFNAALYANATDATTGWEPRDFASFAAAHGAGDASQRCITDGTYSGWVTANTAAGAKQGIDGTPTMLIDGQQTDTLSGQALTDRINQLTSA